MNKKTRSTAAAKRQPFFSPQDIYTPEVNTPEGPSLFSV